MVIAQQLPQTSRRRHEGHLDRGAVAVEMAIVLPLLMAMIIGIIDFSRIFNGEIQLSQAAREGARIAALGTPGGFTTDDVATRTTAALNNPALQGDVTPTVTMRVVGVAGNEVLADRAVCTGATNYGEVTVSIPYEKIWWGPARLSQKAVMKCTG